MTTNKSSSIYLTDLNAWSDNNTDSKTLTMNRIKKSTNTIYTKAINIDQNSKMLFVLKNTLNDILVLNYNDKIDKIIENIDKTFKRIVFTHINFRNYLNNSGEKLSNTYKDVINPLYNIIYNFNDKFEDEIKYVSNNSKVIDKDNFLFQNIFRFKYINIKQKNIINPISHILQLINNKKVDKINDINIDFQFTNDNYNLINVIKFKESILTKFEQNKIKSLKSNIELYIDNQNIIENKDIYKTIQKLINIFYITTNIKIKYIISEQIIIYINKLFNIIFNNFNELINDKIKNPSSINKKKLKYVKDILLNYFIEIKNKFNLNIFLGHKFEFLKTNNKSVFIKKLTEDKNGEFIRIKNFYKFYNIDKLNQLINKISNYNLIKINDNNNMSSKFLLYILNLDNNKLYHGLNNNIIDKSNLNNANNNNIFDNDVDDDIQTLNNYIDNHKKQTIISYNYINDTLNYFDNRIVTKHKQFLLNNATNKIEIRKIYQKIFKKIYNSYIELNKIKDKSYQKYLYHILLYYINLMYNLCNLTVKDEHKKEYHKSILLIKKIRNKFLLKIKKPNVLKFMQKATDPIKRMYMDKRNNKLTNNSKIPLCNLTPTLRNYKFISDKITTLAKFNNLYEKFFTGFMSKNITFYIPYFNVSLFDKDKYKFLNITRIIKDINNNNSDFNNINAYLDKTDEFDKDFYIIMCSDLKEIKLKNKWRATNRSIFKNLRNKNKNEKYKFIFSYLLNIKYYIKYTKNIIKSNIIKKFSKNISFLIVLIVILPVLIVALVI